MPVGANGYRQCDRCGVDHYPGEHDYVRRMFLLDGVRLEVQDDVGLPLEEWQYLCMACYRFVLRHVDEVHGIDGFVHGSDAYYDVEDRYHVRYPTDDEEHERNVPSFVRRLRGGVYTPYRRVLREDRAFPTADHAPRGDEEQVDTMEHITGHNLLLPVLPNRDNRLISFEQEVGFGGSYIAHHFHAAGFCAGQVQGYHSSGSQRPLDSGMTMHVEHDGSVDAEVIYGRMDLSNPAVVEDFGRGLAIVRKGIRTKNVQLDARCGGHMHVDARGLDMHNLASLYFLWGGLEDTLFRIGSARWQNHRSVTYNNNYAGVVPKGYTTRRDIWSAMRDGRESLNMTPYLHSRQQCQCGATAIGAWDECTCSLRKPTIEFRVWNTTANRKKINAYSALSLSLIEWARRNTVRAGEVPANEWRAIGPDRHRSKWATDFILTQLPLTDEERGAVQYCIDHSTLAEPTKPKRGKKVVA